MSFDEEDEFDDREDPDLSDQDSTDESADACPHCGEYVFEDMAVCPHCHESMEPQAHHWESRGKWFIAGLIACVIILLLVVLTRGTLF